MTTMTLTDAEMAAIARTSGSRPGCCLRCDSHGWVVCPRCVAEVVAKRPQQ